jgi:hypothetical protein
MRDANESGYKHYQRAQPSQGGDRAEREASPTCPHAFKCREPVDTGLAPYRGHSKPMIACLKALSYTSADRSPAIGENDLDRNSRIAA